MARRPFLCFVHIERAGGTTLHRLLRHRFPTYVRLRPWYVWANEPEHHFTPRELRALVSWLPMTSGIGGHTTRSWLGYGDAIRREVFYFTFVRDPIARYMSHFNYQRLVKGIDWSLDAFLAEPHFDDYQTRRLAGRADVEAAREVLRNRMAFVGMTERFDESLLLFARALGIPWRGLLYEKENELPSGDAIRFDTLPEAQQERVRAANAADLELYARVRDELFPEQAARYPALEADLEEFRRQNGSYVYPALRERLATRYHWAVSRFLEPRLHRRYGAPPVRS